MGNVLRKLAFQSCLVIFAVLQTGIKTYDVPRNVSQFIVGKMDVCVTYVLIFSAMSAKMLNCLIFSLRRLV